MNVLFVTHYTGLYGANKSLLELVTTLRDSYGVTPLILVPAHGDISEELGVKRIEQMSVRFYPWVVGKNERSVIRKIKNIRKQTKNSLALKKALKKIRQFDPDIIHSNSSVIDFGAFLSQKLGVPHVWHFREFGDLDYSLTFLDKKSKVRKCLNSKADRLIFISHALHERYLGLLDKPEKAVVIYNGVDQSHYSNSLIGTIPSNTQYTILMLGILIKSKGHADALEALKIIVEKEESIPIKLILAGSGSSEYKRSLEKYISLNRLSEFVQFLGYVKDPRTLFSRCNVGIVCSRSEAFGRVTVEMMMSGVPVIVSNTGANCEIVESNQTGLVYQCGNPTDLAEKIQELMHNPRKARRMAEEARQRAIQKFSSKRNAFEIFSIYRSILTGQLSNMEVESCHQESQ